MAIKKTPRPKRSPTKPKPKPKPEIDVNIPKIDELIRPTLQEKERIAILPLFDNAYRVNIRQSGDSIIQRSYFIRINKNQIEADPPI